MASGEGPSSDQVHFEEGDSFAMSESTEAQAKNIDIFGAAFPQPIFRPKEMRRKRWEQHFYGEAKIIEQYYGKRLTQTQLEGLAYWSNKELRLREEGILLGGGFGLGRAYNTRGSWRFPFYNAGPDFSPGRILPFLSESLATSILRASRYSAYATVGVFIGGLMFGSYGTSTASIGRFMDTRTKDIFVELRERAMKQVQERRAGLTKDIHAPASGQSPSTGRSPSPMDEQGFAPEQEAYDPYSPQSPTDSATSTSYGTYSTRSDTKSTPSISSSSSERGSRYKPTQPQYEESSREGLSPDFFGSDSYDDASPTAQYPPPASGSSSGGSAWDRIRSGSGMNPKSGPRAGSSIPDSQDGSFSRADEDRQLAKSQAQQEFDARVEKERQGRNFD